MKKIIALLLTALLALSAAGYAEYIDIGSPGEIREPGEIDLSAEADGIDLSAELDEADLQAWEEKAGVEASDENAVGIPKSVTLGVKQKFTLKGGQGVTYESSMPSVAKVSAKGIVKALKPGSATITCRRKNKVVGACDVKVKKAPTIVKLNRNKATLRVGMTLQLSASLPRGSYSPLKWSSSRPSVAVVDQNGLVTVVGTGKASISVTTYNRKKAKCVVTVPANKLIIDETRLNLTRGNTFQLSAAIDYGETPWLKWRSSKPDVVSVDENGLVTALSKGIATITVSTVNDLKAKCKVKVPAYKLIINETKLKLTEKDTFQLSAAIDSGETPWLSWSTSDPNVASVDENGLVTALSKGSATITVSTVENLKAKCRVKVDYLRDDPASLLWQIEANGFHTLPDVEEALFALMNEYRQSHGLAGVSRHDGLWDAARVRAYECSLSFGHTRPDGRWFATVGPLVGLELIHGRILWPSDAQDAHALASDILDRWTVNYPPGVEHILLDKNKLGGAGVVTDGQSLYAVLVWGFGEDS